MDSHHAFTDTRIQRIFSQFRVISREQGRRQRDAAQQLQRVEQLESIASRHRTNLYHVDRHIENTGEHLEMLSVRELLMLAQFEELSKDLTATQLALQQLQAQVHSGNVRAGLCTCENSTQMAPTDMPVCGTTYRPRLARERTEAVQVRTQVLLRSRQEQQQQEQQHQQEQ
jgi:hypothetical protein